MTELEQRLICFFVGMTAAAGLTFLFTWLGTYLSRRSND